MTNCAIGSIDAFTPSSAMPWNEKRVQHLFRRLGFGIELDNIQYLLSEDPSSYIETAINNAAQPSNDPIPFWANYTWYDFYDFDEQYVLALDFANDWFIKMMDNGIKEKLNLFWSNHFVTQFEVYEFGPFLYNYYKTIEQFAFGNFKDFVSEMGLSQAMLLFLNGAENTRFNPNENYARELYELFTLGVDNGYTETDIQETARALTGYYIEWSTNQVLFEDFIFDDDSKTIFGLTGNWGYNDVIDILFTQKPMLIAKHICGKLYTNFVNPVMDEDIVDALAQTFIDNNFELLPVYQQLFKSEHFFDDKNIGTIVKSPIEILLPFFKALDFDISGVFPYDDQFTWKQVLFWNFQEMGQTIFNPVDVAGWQGNRNWLNSATLVNRWQLFDDISWMLYDLEFETLRNLAIDASGNSNDPAIVAISIVDKFLANGFYNMSSYEAATDVFKWEIPENYFDNGYWNLSWEEAPIQVAVLIQFLVRQPEFQLS